MRIRKDATSYRASGILRRDARHQRNDDHRPLPGRKKDTKRWCRGREGRPHDPARIAKRSYGDVVQWHVYACRRCGKELDYYFPGLSGFLERKPPGWMLR